MTPPPPELRSDGSDDRAERAAAAVQSGDFPAAIALYEHLRQAASTTDDTDKAELNIAMVRLQMGEARRGEEGLREILLRTSDPKIAFHAAYNLACSLRQQGRYERALSYARRALERAQALDSADFLAPVHNLLGNVHLNQNYLDRALAEYRIALSLRERQECDTRFSRAILEENIGYCLILKRRFDAGFERLAVALTLAEEVGDRRCRAECLQDLCYAYLMQGRIDEAIEEGERALEAAQACRFPDIVENCHYLLGELGSRANRLEMRDAHFDALQDLHPEVPFLREFLCTVDVTDVITLKR
ncbi:MAG TPA: tetratricopeptide repeat protein [Candidatus Polarisedimenticolaceae bacterium]|nr:tetratricopeptide repeat protein [Candidatus Polarisedimenticolaceae bacterium]